MLWDDRIRLPTCERFGDIPARPARSEGPLRLTIASAAIGAGLLRGNADTRSVAEQHIDVTPVSDAGAALRRVNLIERRKITAGAPTPARHFRPAAT